MILLAKLLLEMKWNEMKWTATWTEMSSSFSPRADFVWILNLQIWIVATFACRKGQPKLETNTVTKTTKTGTNFARKLLHVYTYNYRMKTRTVFRHVFVPVFVPVFVSGFRTGFRPGVRSGFRSGFRFGVYKTNPFRLSGGPWRWELHAVWQVAVWQVAVWQVAVSNRFRQFQTVEFSFRQLQTGVVAVYTRFRQDFRRFSGSDRSETGI